MHYKEPEQYNNDLYVQYSQPSSSGTSQYIDIAECLFRHISGAANLSAIEKIYYLLLDCESITNLKLGKSRTTAITAKIWASKLGCSKPQIFAMQKTLESKGYISIQRSTNSCNQNNRNVISTSLPREVFKQLAADKTSDRIKVTNNINYNNKDYRSYLDQVKILLKFDFDLFCKVVATKEITYTCKLFCIDYYSPCYMPNISGEDNSQYYNITFTYASLMERYNITRSYLSNILIKLDKMHWLNKYRVEKYINPPVWNAYWQIDKIKKSA